MTLGRQWAVTSEIFKNIALILEGNMSLCKEEVNERSKHYQNTMLTEIDYVPYVIPSVGGIEIAIDRWDTIDPIQKMLRESSFWTPPNFQVIFDAIRVGYRVLDIGSHIGTFSLGAAQLGAEVFAIDASSKNIELLRASIARNGLQRIQAMHSAVGERSGAIGFVEYGAWGYIPMTRSPSQQIVNLLAIDDLVRALGWKHIDFIKMDIEGSELSALHGMGELLSRDDAPIIVSECSVPVIAKMAGKRPYDFKKAMMDCGYSLYLIDPYSLIPVDLDEVQVNMVTDYLCVKPRIDMESTFGTNWKIRDRLTDDENLARLAAEAKMNAPAFKESVMMVLDHLDPALLKSKLGQEILAEVEKKDHDIGASS